MEGRRSYEAEITVQFRAGPNLQLISFDLDGTLIDESINDFFWFYVVPKLLSNQKNISFERALKFCKREYNKVSNKKREWYSAVYWFKRFGIKENPIDVISSLKNKIKVFPDVKLALRKLNKRYKLVLFTTNTKEFFPIKIYNSGLKKYFYKIISITDDFGIGGKTRKAFQMLLNFFRVKPENVMHVGNDFVFDYLNPQSIGIKSILIDRYGNGKNCIKSLIELL